jgi:hypothetical protein
MSTNGSRQGLQRRLVLLVVAGCLTFGSFVGCTAVPEEETSVPAPVPASVTETVNVDADFWPLASLDELIGKSSSIVSGRILDFRYDTWSGEVSSDDGPVPGPPQATTVTTFEITAVFSGSFKAGDRVEIWEMGGVMDKIMWTYDQWPYLPDHQGEELVLFLATWEYPPAKGTPFVLTHGLHSVWLNESGRLSLLEGAAYDPKTHPWITPAVNPYGGNGFPTVMTVEELKQAIAEHK